MKVTGIPALINVTVRRLITRLATPPIAKSTAARSRNAICSVETLLVL